MSGLFPIMLDAETFRSPRLRIEPVTNETMEPTLRLGDFVLCLPTTRFVTDGLYVMDAHGGDGLEIYRCHKLFGNGRIRLSRDNPLYRQGEQIVARDAFETSVLAIVVADVKVRDEHLLRAAITTGGRP